MELAQVINIPTLPYHERTCSFLQNEESECWDWFETAEAQRDMSNTVRIDLLKSSYRLDIREHPELYADAKDLLSKLNLDIPITLYQAQGEEPTSAALYYLPGEAHIVFFGKIIELLDQQEIKVVMAHEISHYVLWQLNEGKFLISDILLNAMACDSRAENAHLESARRFQLFTEIFADRGALQLMEDKNLVVQTLVKVNTGLSTVSGEAYLRQASEIFTCETPETEGLTHPESYIRAWALELFEQKVENYEARIEDLICGDCKLDELDLLDQAKIASETLHLIQIILDTEWLRNQEVFHNRAKLYLNDEIKLPPPPLGKISELKDPKLKEYFVYILSPLPLIRARFL